MPSRDEGRPVLDVVIGADNAQARLAGELSFASGRQFRQVIDQLTRSGARCIRLDLGGVSFIDSAGLGMLLLLREEAGKVGQAVVLSRPAGQVRRMFEISKFETLFTLD